MSNLSQLFSNGVQTGQRLRLLHVADQRASGTNGGTFTSGAWQTRTLNTVVTNEIIGASLSSNQIILPAGEYVVEVATQTYTVNHNKVRIRNITDSTDILIGLSNYNYSAAGIEAPSLLTGKFTFSSTKTVELQHRCDNTVATYGFGTANGFGVVEVYADVKIWQILDSRALPNQAELLQVEDQKTLGTHGGTFTSGAWQTRVLNTVVTNQIDGASLSSNQITLPAGSYYMECNAPGYNCRYHKAKLYNVSDTADISIGPGTMTDTNMYVQTQAIVSGNFTIASQKTLELRHRCTSTFSLGFGVATSLGNNETYSVVKIWKIS